MCEIGAKRTRKFVIEFFTAHEMSEDQWNRCTHENVLNFERLMNTTGEIRCHVHESGEAKVSGIERGPLTVFDLVCKLEELGYAGDTLQVGYYSEGVLCLIDDVKVEEVPVSTRNENWHPVDSPQIVFKGVKRVVILS